MLWLCSLLCSRERPDSGDPPPVARSRLDRSNGASRIGSSVPLKPLMPAHRQYQSFQLQLFAARPAPESKSHRKSTVAPDLSIAASPHGVPSPRTLCLLDRPGL